MIDGGTWTAPEAVKDTANAFKETIKLDNGHATLANIGYTPKGKADDSHTGNGKWYKDCLLYTSSGRLWYVLAGDD